MTKKIFAMIVAVVICLSMAVSASAYTDTYVYDPDYLLSDSETAELEDRAAAIEEDSGYSVIFCIVSDCEGLSCAEYAEKAYASYTDAENAVVFVNDTALGTYDYFLAGEAVSLDEASLDLMWSAYNADGSYYGGLSSFYASAAGVIESAVSFSDIQTDDGYADYTDTVTEAEESEEFYEEDEIPEYDDGGKTFDIGFGRIIGCLIAGLLIGFLIVKAIASKNTSVYKQKNATVYTRSNSMVLTGSADNFLYNKVERRAKPKNNKK